jgi:hypothetical protein
VQVRGDVPMSIHPDSVAEIERDLLGDDGLGRASPAPSPVRSCRRSNLMHIKAATLCKV